MLFEHDNFNFYREKLHLYLIADDKRSPTFFINKHKRVVCSSCLSFCLFDQFIKKVLYKEYLIETHHFPFIFIFISASAEVVDNLFSYLPSTRRASLHLERIYSTRPQSWPLPPIQIMDLTSHPQPPPALFHPRLPIH